MINFICFVYISQRKNKSYELHLMLTTYLILIAIKFF